MLDTPSPYRVVCEPGLPVAKLVIGKPAEDAAAILPRLFNLCRAAQATAAHMAMGLPAPEVDLSGEIIRDHLMKFYVTWPRLLGGDPMPLPDNWQAGGEALLDSLFAALFPETSEDFEAALLAGNGIAPTLVALADAVPPGTGAGAALPALTTEAAFAPGAFENSIAGRQSDHPVLRHIEETRGRDLFWRAVARVYDLADACLGTLPQPELVAPGQAVVPAARGTYAVSATVEDGIVTAFARVTPTDHLLASGGIMDITLSSLPDADQRILDLTMDILDPCSPVSLEESKDA